MMDDLPVCDMTDGCITCGDIALPLTVIDVCGADARCQGANGHVELVAIELVAEVQPGDRLLVHAGVALERLTRDQEGTSDALR